MKGLILFLLMNLMLCPLLSAAEPTVVPVMPVDGVTVDADESPELCRGPIRETVKAVAAVAVNTIKVPRQLVKDRAWLRQPGRRIARAVAAMVRARVQRARARRA